MNNLGCKNKNISRKERSGDYLTKDKNYVGMQKTENNEKMYRRLRNVSNTQLLTVNLIITQPERSE